MNIRKLTENELADLAANVATLLAGTELSAIDSHVRADLITALGTMPADLVSQTAAALVVDTEKRAAVSTKDTTFDGIENWFRRLRDALKSGLAPKEQFDLVGLTYPATRSAKYIAQDPTELSVVGFSNGVNKGRFTGNNRPGVLMYEIWRRDGDDGVWQKHMLVSKQSFVDTGITPGQYYEYRVRAMAKQTVSNYSNSAVVYGVL